MQQARLSVLSLGKSRSENLAHLGEPTPPPRIGRGVPETWARRLKLLRPFTRWLRQFEPRTEVPHESLFGPVRGRVAPHIYREDEIVALLAATRGLNPLGSLRSAAL